MHGRYTSTSPIQLHGVVLSKKVQEHLYLNFIFYPLFSALK